MKTKSFTIVLAVLIMALVVCCAAGTAGRPVLPSNETSSLNVDITATAVGSLKSDTSLTFTQGNGNLINNPPLDPNGEGQATIGYNEKTIATSGSINYTKDISLDTSGQDQISSNLETFRSIDYTNDGDGDGVGTMYSTESIMIDECATAATAENGACCPWIDNTNVQPATCVLVIAGSEVILEEGKITSIGTATTVSTDPAVGIALSYDVNVTGSDQTNNPTAEGKATVFTEALIMEGTGNETNMTTQVEYANKVSVEGLIQIAMVTGYNSPA